MNKYEETRKKIEEANIIFARTRDMEKMLRYLSISGQEIIGADASSIILYHDNIERLMIDIANGVVGKEIEGYKFEPDKGLAGLVFQGKEEYILSNNVQNDPRHYVSVQAKTNYNIHNLLAVPLKTPNKNIGVYEVINKNKNGQIVEFISDDVNISLFFAMNSASVIDYARRENERLSKERSEIIKEYIGTAAHEMKNLILAESGSIDLIKAGLNEHNQELTLKGIELVEESNQRLYNYLRDMLSLTRKSELKYEKANLNEIVENIIDSRMLRIQELNIHLEKEFEKLKENYFDIDGISRSFMNIFENALDAVKEIKERKIVVRTYEDMKYQYMTIKDNGPGIQPLKQDEIFELYYTTKGSKGTGIGLAVVKKIIEEHKGKVWVDSRVGNGAQFTIQIPLKY